MVVYFEHEDLNSEIKSLKKERILFNTDTTHQPWLWREALLNDPDGNQIILYHAGENRKNPPWKLVSRTKGYD